MFLRRSRSSLLVYVFVFLLIGGIAQSNTLAQLDSILSANYAGSSGTIRAARHLWFPDTPQKMEALVRGPREALLDGVQDLLSIEVDTTDDTVDAVPGDGACADAGGNCSLRAAIMEANARAGEEFINVPAGTYTLTIAGAGENAGATGDLDITSPEFIGIYGSFDGADTIIDAAGIDRVLHATGAYFALADLTITGGNEITFGAGGILALVGTYSLYNVTVSGNQTSMLVGGAFLGGDVYVADSTFSGNTSTSETGGLITGSSGTAYIYDSTFSGNTAAGVIGGFGVQVGSSAYLYNSTVTDNTADDGGGIWTAGTIFLQNSLVAGNTGTTAGPDCAVSAGVGTMVSDGSNLIGDDSDCTFTPKITDLVGTGGSPIDPLIGPLADNGGKTQTHALLPGSPARDAAFGYCTYADQRGVRRPQDGNVDGARVCDIGAFEFALPFTLTSPIPNETYTFPAVDVVWTATNPPAAAYRVQIRSLGLPYTHKKKLNSTEACLGSVCSYYPFLAGIPNRSTLDVRVIALTTPKVRTVRHPFKTEVPGPVTLVSPNTLGSVADTTPTLSWFDNYNASQYRIKVFDVATGALVKGFKLNSASTPARDTVCVIGTCELDLGAIATTLTVGKSYSWQVQATVTYVGAGSTSYNYKTKSPKWVFKVVEDPGLMPLPPAADLRGAGF